MFEGNSLCFRLYCFLHYISYSTLNIVDVIDWKLADLVIENLRYGELMLELSNILINYTDTFGLL